MREPAYLAWLRRQPCVFAFTGQCEGPIQACHIRTSPPGQPPTGLQTKPDDRRAWSGCAKHHADQHGMAELRFWAAYGLDPYETAERLHAQFERGDP